MKTQIKRLLLTIGFMTRIPINVDLGEVKDEDMHKGFLYYPVVGLILGLLCMAVYLLVSLLLPETFGILSAMLAYLCLTGAFHLDGLSDTADGIYSARTKERMLEIMKDSRIGTNGGIAMCFDLALKFAGIYYLDIRWLMILLMPIVGKMVQGAIVSGVVEGSAAEKAGLKASDIIVAIDGKEIASRDELESAKKGYNAGDSAVLKVYREGQYIELTIVFDELTPEALEAGSGEDEESPAPEQNGSGYAGGYGGYEDFFREFFGGSPFGN